MKYTIVLLLSLVALLLLNQTRRDNTVEPFDPKPLAKSTASKVARKVSGVRAVKSSTLTNVTFANDSLGLGDVKYWFNGKTKVVRLKGSVKHTLANGTAVLSSNIYVKGYGRSRATAETDAKVQAQKVLNEVTRELRAKNLAE